MAENKKGFVLYRDLIHTLEHLKDEDAGKVFKWILEYVNDQNPDPLPGLLAAVVEPIRQQLKRDLIKWGDKKEKQSESGSLGNLKRWHPDLYNEVVKGNIKLSEAIKIGRDRSSSVPDKPESDGIAKIAVTDTVTVTVSDNVNVTDTNINNNKSGLILKNVEIEMLNSKEWIVSVCRNAKAQGLNLSPEQCKEYISRFCIEQEACGELDRPFRELKKHFIHWVITKLKCEPTKKKPNDNKILDV